MQHSSLNLNIQTRNLKVIRVGLKWGKESIKPQSTHKIRTVHDDDDLVKDQADKGDYGDENTEHGEEVKTGDRVETCEEDGDSEGGGVGEKLRHSSNLTCQFAASCVTSWKNISFKNISQ